MVRKRMIQDPLDPFRPERIGFSKCELRLVGIPHDVLSANRVLWPVRRPSMPAREVVRVEVMDEGRPARAHQLGKVRVRGRLVRERVDGSVSGIVTVAVDVVEDEGDLLEVRDAH